MKIFISQPIKGLSEKEIKSNREKAIKKIKSLYGDDAEIIDSYIEGGGTPLWCLGKSIELLSTADVAYFLKGWNTARGCRIEYMCADNYGIGAYFEEE
ncbi:DUF4406 domain-containing protein [Catenibacterium mitsuokai]|uniref:DUF4406 domain-containing protein n=1 Tax=Catenibacterium mitsuokai TaxID=100886 RepID=UPI00319DB27E